MADRKTRSRDVANPARRSARIVLLLSCSTPLLVLCALLAIPSTDAAGLHSPGSEPSTAPQPKKIALIVAISKYDRQTGWWPIHSNNDVPLIREALIAHRFDAIHVLENEKATKDGILAAFNRHLLEPADKGDIVVFHYSGHGQQITDDNRDEVDGYDETIVPYDAPEKPRNPSYRGEKHLRDDTINGLVRELRKEVGPTGNVVLFFDSCFSGSITRGVTSYRGSSNPIGEPAEDAPSSSRQEAGGFFEAPITRRSEGESTAGAPYVVFSATRHDELSKETKGAGGKYVGSLSLALSRALKNAGTKSSYRDVFEDVESRFPVKNQYPQVEGDVDSVLFMGRAVSQEPYFEIEEILPGGFRVRVKGGKLAGLLDRSLVEFHGAGTKRPTSQTRLAAGEVFSSSDLDSTIVVDRAGRGRIRSDSRVFVTSYSYGGLKIRVQLRDLKSALRDQIKSAASSPRLRTTVELSESNPDLIVTQVEANELGQGKKAGIIIETAQDGVVVYGPEDPAQIGLASTIAKQLQNYARYRYLGDLEPRAAGLKVEFKLLPVILECKDETREKDCEITRKLDPRERTSPGNTIEFRLADGKVGDGFLVELTHKGDRAAYVSILDLMPNGQIGLLWPLMNMRGDDNLLQPGQSFVINVLGDSGDPEPVPYSIIEPEGKEVLKLFATEHPFDFRAITTPATTIRGRSARGPLEELLDEVYWGARATPTMSVGKVNAFSVTMRVRR